MSDNYKLLRPWLEATIADNPDILKAPTAPTEIYADLYNIWVNEIQATMKEMVLELGPRQKDGEHKNELLRMQRIKEEQAEREERKWNL